MRREGLTGEEEEKNKNWFLRIRKREKQNMGKYLLQRQKKNKVNLEDLTIQSLFEGKKLLREEKNRLSTWSSKERKMSITSD